MFTFGDSGKPRIIDSLKDKESIFGKLYISLH